MTFSMKRSEIDSDLMEVWHDGQVIREISVPFLIRKMPKSFESLEKIEQWLKEREWKSALFSAYRWISMRNYPSVLLLKKLELKKFSPSVCLQVIEEMKKNGYLQDEEFLQNEILREFRRGYGPRYIELKLRSKGLPTGKVRQIISDSMQKERIQQMIAKIGVRSDRLAKQKAIRTLQRRGFDLDIVLKELI